MRVYSGGIFPPRSENTHNKLQLRQSFYKKPGSLVVDSADDKCVCENKLHANLPKNSVSADGVSGASPRRAPGRLEPFLEHPQEPSPISCYFSKKFPLIRVPGRAQTFSLSR